MKRFAFLLFVGFAVFTVTIACAQQPAADKAAAGPEATVVARFADQTITATELEEEVGPSLVTLRQQLFEAKSRGLSQLVFDRLVELEAAKAEVSSEEYIRQNVDSKLAEPAEEEINQVLQQYRSRLPADDEQARKQVVDYLKSRARHGVLEELRGKLFTVHNVKILLDPPRAKVHVADFNPARGPVDAAVTMVEFTDFQCPHCSRLQPTLKQVMQRYEGNIRHVFKNYPLPFHDQARLAAEAALCAADQGKFWELHDWMFANFQSLGREQIVAQAIELGVDEAKLNACLDENVHATKIDADMADAGKVGVNATPSVMINGRLVSGARPLESFVEVIDEELVRAGIEPPVVEEPAQPEQPQQPAQPAPAEAES